MRKYFRPGTLLARSAVCAFTALIVLAASPAKAIEFGTASVMSGQGQRLKVAIPFIANPGELVSVTQFQVMASEAASGTVRPDPARFTLSMPMNRNVLFLQSEELMNAGTVHLVVGLAGRRDSDVRYDLLIP